MKTIITKLKTGAKIAALVGIPALGAIGGCGCNNDDSPHNINDDSPHNITDITNNLLCVDDNNAVGMKMILTSKKDKNIYFYLGQATVRKDYTVFNIPSAVLGDSGGEYEIKAVDRDGNVGIGTLYILEGVTSTKPFE